MPSKVESGDPDHLVIHLLVWLCNWLDHSLIRLSWVCASTFHKQTTCCAVLVMDCRLELLAIQSLW